MDKCRVCLSENLDEKLSLDTEILNHQTVADLINFCSGIEVNILINKLSDKHICKKIFLDIAR